MVIAEKSQDRPFWSIKIVWRHRVERWGNWQATNAKTEFSALLDAVAHEGPQRIQRRKLTFVVTTKQEFERRVAEANAENPKQFVSAWDSLKPTFDERYDDVEFPRVDSEVRPVDFE